MFGHDGHGSVRVLTDLAASALQFFVYDAYGQLVAIMNGAGTLVSGGNGALADAAQALTSILYSGEQTDAATGLQYLRARYYDPATGRFNRLDPFFGNLQDPQSFHKYLYTHADPVNGVDPTGLLTLGQVQVAITIGTGLIGAGVGYYFGGARGALVGLVAGLAVGLLIAGIWGPAIHKAIVFNFARTSATVATGGVAARAGASNPGRKA